MPPTSAVELAYRTVIEYVSVVLSHPACDTLLQQSQDTHKAPLQHVLAYVSLKLHLLSGNFYLSKKYTGM